MKKTIFKLKVILFVLAISIAGCNTNKEEFKEESKEPIVAFVEKLASARKSLVAYEKLPENVRFFTPLLDTKVYKGKWNNRNVYYVESVLSQCLMCVHFDNGESITWWADVSIYNDFLSTSKNWVLVYETPKSSKK